VFLWIIGAPQGDPLVDFANQANIAIRSRTRKYTAHSASDFRRWIQASVDERLSRTNWSRPNRKGSELVASTSQDWMDNFRSQVLLRANRQERPLAERRCESAYEVVPVVVVVVDEDVPAVLVVGPPALLAETASAIPNPAKARVAIIIVVFVSQFCA
jgi:hypothetical protein